MDSIRKIIANFSLAFTKNYRVTILLLIATLILGAASYTTFLKRDGTPAVQIPMVVVQTPYFVDDSSLVDEEVTQPLEEAISNVTVVNELTSTSDSNYSVIIAELQENTDSDEGERLIREEVDASATLPEDIEVDYLTYNAGTYDGDHEIIISIAKEGEKIIDIQNKAADVAEELLNLDEVQGAEAIEQITKQVNPYTGLEMDYRSSFSRIAQRNDDGLYFQDAVCIGITQNKQYGIIDVSDAVRDKIETLQNEGELEGYAISYGGDIAEYSRSAISGLEENAITGILAVIVILFLFMNWRASIVAAVFIPTVVAAAFAALYILGFRLNIIVLYGVILLLGLIVDDAIVIVEAVDRHKRQGKRGLEAVKSAITDVGLADISGTLTTILVFAPMAFISGILGDFIIGIPLTVMITLSLSLVIALTLTAFMSSWIIPNYKKQKAKTSRLFGIIFYGFGNFISMIGGKVGVFVNWYLSRPIVAIIIFLLALAGMGLGGYYATQLKFDIMAPGKDSDNMIIMETYSEGTTLDEAQEIAREVEDKIIDNYGGNIEEITYISGTTNESTLYVTLIPMEERSTTSGDIVEGIDGIMKEYDRASVTASNSQVGGPPSVYQFYAQVYNDDTEKLREATDDIVEFLNGREITDGEKVLEVSIDYLDTVARWDGRRYAQVKVKVSDPDNSGLLVALQEQMEEEYATDKLDSLGLAENAMGYDQGMEAEFMKSFNSAIFALIIALIVMYVLLVVQFNSFLLPLLVLLAIPFTFAGLFPGLYSTGNAMSFFVLVGMIALSGIVVNNTIMLIDFANRRRLSGKGIKDSISEAISIRFRPILITTVTTIIALIPLSRDPFWESLTYTIMFGLAASTAMVIIAFPVYYAIIEWIRTLKSKLFKRISSKN